MSRRTSTMTDLEQQHQKILYTIQEARCDMGVKLNQLEKIGVPRATYESVVYGLHSPRLITVMRIADSMGMEVIIRRKPDWDDTYAGRGWEL